MLLLKLAFRNILRQKRRSILTGLSMAGGYLLCAFSISLSEGSYNNIINLFTLDHTGHVQIHKDDYLKKPKAYKYIASTTEIAAVLDKNPHVKAYSYRIFTPALAYSDSGNLPARVIGVDLDREQDTSRLKQKVKQGQYISSAPNEDGYYQAMIGGGIANSLHITLGDELILISQGADGSIANDIFIVGAIIGDKNSLDKGNVFLPLNAARIFVGIQQGVHEVAILLKDTNKARSTASDIASKLPELTVSPWQEVEDTFYKSMQSDKKGNRFTLSIIVFIVFIGVLNTVLMSVLERTKEFGVLRAIGSRPTTILQLIILETFMLSLLSIFVGFLFSIPAIAWFTLVGFEFEQAVDVGGISFNYMTGEFSVPVFLWPMVAILSFSLLVSIPPGIRAARISPTQAMGEH